MQRIYVVPAERSATGPGDLTVSAPIPTPGDIERWCYSCRTLYSHTEMPSD